MQLDNVAKGEIDAPMLGSFHQNRPPGGRDDAPDLHDMGVPNTHSDVIGEVSHRRPQGDDVRGSSHNPIATPRSNFEQLPIVAIPSLGSKAMKTRGERLRYLREKAGFTSARDAAIQFGVAVSTYNAHERAGQPGGRDFDEALASKYARWFNGNLIWLFHGEGTATASAAQEPDFPPDPDELKAVTRRRRQRLEPGEVLEVNTYGGAGNMGVGTQIVVDGELVDGVRATWRLPVDFLHTELRAKEADVEMLPIDGDSMIPTLLPGDRVMINRRHNAVSVDGLYAIGGPFGVQVKRLEWVKGTQEPIMIRIISDNPQHSAAELSVDELHVIGRVICRISRL